MQRPGCRSAKTLSLASRALALGSVAFVLSDCGSRNDDVPPRSPKATLDACAVQRQPPEMDPDRLTDSRRVVLGCGTLPSGRTFRFSATADEGTRGETWACVYMNYSKGHRDFACFDPSVPSAIRGRAGVFPYGIDPNAPAILLGTSSSRITEVSVRYALRSDGFLRMARAVLIPVRDAVAEKLGSAEPFSFFAVELRPGNGICVPFLVRARDQRGLVVDEQRSRFGRGVFTDRGLIYPRDRTATSLGACGRHSPRASALRRLLAPRTPDGGQHSEADEPHDDQAHDDRAVPRALGRALLALLHVR